MEHFLPLDQRKIVSLPLGRDSWLMWSNVFSHVDKGRFLFLIYFYEGVFNEKTKDI